LAVVIVVVAAGAAYFLTADNGTPSVKQDDNHGIVHEVNKYDISIAYIEGGYASGTGTYSQGSTATLTATPSEGYYFVGWYENSVLYSINSTFKITVNSPHTFVPKFEKKTFTVTLSSNYPSAGIISGGGTVQYGNIVTLNASVNSGYTFSGWYDGSSLISGSRNYDYTVKDNAALIAEYSIIHDASFTFSQSKYSAPATVTATSTYNVEIYYRTWTMTDAITGKTIYSLIDYGSGDRAVSTGVYEGKALKVTQTVTYSDGQKSTSTSTAVVDENVTKHFSWRYQKAAWYSSITNLFGINNNSMTWDIPLSFAWYYNALSSTVPRGNGFYTLSSYITYNDPEIRAMAQALINSSSGMSDIQRVNYVLKFVQGIPYQYDIDGKGVSEYWKLPAETLWEGKGDCEDHAFLFASLIKAMGYKVVIFDVDCYENGKFVAGHIATGVDVSGGSGAYVTVNGERYYYCEATATDSAGWYDYANVGYQPSGYVIMQTYVV